MTVKRWISLAIVVAVVVGALALIKLFPFWVTVACLIALVGGFAAGYLAKNTVEEVIELVDPSTVMTTSRTGSQVSLPMRHQRQWLLPERLRQRQGSNPPVD